MTINEDEVRALNARDEIQRATGLDLHITWDGRKRAWTAGLNNPGALHAVFDGLDDAIDWAFWYAGRP